MSSCCRTCLHTSKRASAKAARFWGRCRPPAWCPDSSTASLRRASVCRRRFSERQVRCASMDNNLLIIVILSIGFFLLLGYGVYLQATRRRAKLSERMETYATIEAEAAEATQTELQAMSQVPRFLHLVLGRGYMSRLE